MICQHDAFKPKRDGFYPCGGGFSGSRSKILFLHRRKQSEQGPKTEAERVQTGEAFSIFTSSVFHKNEKVFRDNTVYTSTWSGGFISRRTFLPINVKQNKNFQVPIFGLQKTGGCDFVQRRSGHGTTFFITECVCVCVSFFKSI